MTTSKVTFENPPISEVVIAIYFNPPLANFRSQHVGLFWERIKEEFPVAEQQIPLGVIANVGADEPFPMPRYWFIADDDVNLIQIQKDAFIFNWRRRGDNQYPGFHINIKPTFDRLYGQFETFLRTEVSIPELSVDLCELTYVDTIEQCDYWRGPADTRNVIRFFSNPLSGVEGAANSAFDCSYAYSMGDGLALSIRMRSMVDPQRSGRPVMALEMKANKRFGGVQKTNVDGWFERAHDTIIRYFMTMTSEDVQRDHWGIRTEDVG